MYPTDIYPVDKCYFCSEQLKYTPAKVSKCHCNYEYVVDRYSLNRSLDRVFFSIGEYKFEIRENETIIFNGLDNPPIPLYRIKQQLFINKNNYFSVIERLKKLQLFS